MSQLTCLSASRQQAWMLQAQKKLPHPGAWAPSPAHQRRRCAWQHRHRQQGSTLVRSNPDPLNSPLFQSEIFQQEMNDMTRQLLELSSMYGKFADFDTEGRKLYLEQMESLVDKLQISVTRAKLAANDPYAQEMLRMQAVQMLNANTNLELMVAGTQQLIADMRSMIAVEESTCDPAVLARLKQEWRERSQAMGTINFQQIFKDPLVLEGATDPQALKAANEVMQDPAAVEKYADRPALYAFLRKTVLGQ